MKKSSIVLRRKKESSHISVRIIFSLLVMLERLVVVLISWLGSMILDHFFSITLHVPTVVWLLLFSLLLGSVITSFLSWQFFAPITRLSKAMNRVAQGDFSVRLEAKHPLKEIREIYANFNLMTQELGATEILQTDFVSNVSHEFKTPISAIEGYATLLQDDAGNTPDERRVYVDKILFNTRRLSRLVHNILLLSRVDNQAILSNCAPYRLDEQVRQTIVMLEPEWDRKNLDFDVSMDEISFTGNEGMLTHVWSNLLGNAIKFSPEEGLITITMHQKDSGVVFTIQDQGPGIDETVQSHLFDKFYQGDSSHKSEGNGLGLALVKQIVTAYEGSISACNCPEGGCRFTVHLPM